MDTTYVDRTYHIAFTTYDKSLGLEYTSDDKDTSLNVKVIDTDASSIAINSNTTTTPYFVAIKDGNIITYISGFDSENINTDTIKEMYKPSFERIASNN